MSAPLLSSAQRHMLRFALGLTLRPVSYRNSYTLPAPSDACDEWLELVAKGLARESSAVVGVGRRGFMATYAGARAVLEPGETLDPEDFPEVAS